MKENTNPENIGVPVTLVLILIIMIMWMGIYKIKKHYVYGSDSNQSISFEPGKYLIIGRWVIGKPAEGKECFVTNKTDYGFTITNKCVSLREIYKGEP